MNGIFKSKSLADICKLAGVTALMGTGIAVLVMVSLPAHQVAADSDHFYSFEQSMAPWVAASNPGATSFSLKQGSGDNGCPDMLGNHYAKLDFTPTSYSPAAWMTANFKGSGLDLVSVDWAAKDKGSCDLCQPIVYVGSDSPTSSSQFEENGRQAGSEWWAHHYPLPPGPAGPVPNTGTIYVAIGFRAPGGNVANVAHYGGMDCVNVRITSVESDVSTSGEK